MSWFENTPETQQLLAEERLVLDATKMVCQALNERGVTRQQLADRLGISASEITQRLRGGRNLTLRSLAAMMDALDYDTVLTRRDRHSQTRVSTLQAVPAARSPHSSPSLS